jgi:hypothetical protein
MVSGVAIARRHEAPVDVEESSEGSMSEPIGDGAKVDPRGQHFGGDEVA